MTVVDSHNRPSKTSEEERAGSQCTKKEVTASTNTDEGRHRVDHRFNTQPGLSNVKSSIVKCQSSRKAKRANGNHHQVYSYAGY
jgi:hypothetical protein